MKNITENRPQIIVRGGGDLATGTIYSLFKAGFKILVLEIEYPAAIRRYAAVSEAVYQGSMIVEDMETVLVHDLAQLTVVWKEGKVPIYVDPAGDSIRLLKPMVVVDAILAKKNLGTSRDMAPFTIGLGPGFTAKKDVDVVAETMRGHNLGRIITKGAALPNTGIPGNVGGYTAERVIHSEAEGVLYGIRKIGDLVTKGEEIAYIENPNGRVSVNATITGVLRGLIRDGYPVTKGFKIADIDPREGEKNNCYTISDKARCIGGGVLMAVCGFFSEQK